MHITFDKEKLIKIMNDFYSLTKIKIVVYDSGFNAIAAVPLKECDYCTEIRNNCEGFKRCNESTTKAIRLCKEKNSINIYKCHSGLIEAVAPIKLNGVIAGYIMLGQLLEKNEKEKKKEAFISYASKFTGADVSACFDNLNVKSYEDIESAARLMESCACYLLMRNIIKEDSESLAFLIDNYISDNISADLSVNKICDKFKISRNRLYKISDLCFAMPIGEYIRKKRIDIAKELIKNGVSVTEVSERTGFCDYVYFGKVFKSLVGISPTKFKKDN